MKRVFSIAFVAVLSICMALTCFFSARALGSSLYKSFRNNRLSSFVRLTDNMFGAFEKAVSDNFYLRESGVDIYGGIQKLLGKKIVRDESKTVVKGSDSKLYFTDNIMLGDSDLSVPIRENIDRLSALDKYCKTKGVKLLFAIAPHKYNSQSTRLPIEGVKDYFETASSFEQALLEKNCCCLNLMRMWNETENRYSDGFFTTDHHWNIETAFWGYQEICNQLNSYDGYGIPATYISSDSYNVKTVPNAFLGSMGVRVGSLYAGKDSFSIISPAFPTNFLVEYQTKTLKTSVRREGGFKDSILDKTLGYDMYITSDNAFIHVDNKQINGGHKTLFVKDSFGVPVAAWLSCWNDELWEVDLRYKQDGSIEDYIEDFDVDTAIILYNPEVLTSNLFFEFSVPSPGK